jgi:hypothetical protein
MGRCSTVARWHPLLYVMDSSDSFSSPAKNRAFMSTFLTRMVRREFWLTPQVGLPNHTGLSVKQCHEAQLIVETHIEEIRNAWHHHFGS